MIEKKDLIINSQLFGQLICLRLMLWKYLSFVFLFLLLMFVYFVGKFSFYPLSYDLRQELPSRLSSSSWGGSGWKTTHTHWVIWVDNTRFLRNTSEIKEKKEIWNLDSLLHDRLTDIFSRNDLFCHYHFKLPLIGSLKVLL